MLKRLEDRIVQAERGLLVGLLSFMVLLSFVQVILRVCFSMGLLWADTVLRHLVLWLAFLGAGLAASSDRQFAMDLSTRLLTGRMKAWGQGICHAFAAGVSIFLFQAALTFLRQERSHASTLLQIAGQDIPAWPFEVIVPIGFALLAVHYLIKTLATTAGPP